MQRLRLYLMRVLKLIQNFKQTNRMSDFNFITDLDSLDGRAIFANRILKLIYEKNNGDLSKSIQEAKPYFYDLDEYVRNIYELIDAQIPLYAYYHLITLEADNWCFEDDEYKDAIERTKKACELYYK